MPKVTFYTLKGKSKKKINLPKDIFGAKINKTLLAQAVRVYLANQRKAKAKTKTRAEVRGSRRKIWRQKGTGRARHGDRYAPIFVGGGRAHGPTGQENYSLKLTKKARRRSLFAALTAKFKAGKVIVVSGLEKLEPKTKKMAAFLKKMSDNQEKILIVLPQKMENLVRATRNIKRVNLVYARLLNTYQVLKNDRIIFTQESLSVLEKAFLGKDSVKRGKR